MLPVMTRTVFASRRWRVDLKWNGYSASFDCLGDSLLIKLEDIERSIALFFIPRDMC